MERSEPQKYQLTIQQNEGLPPGTIASGYGIREYYTIPTSDTVYGRDRAKLEEGEPSKTDEERATDIHVTKSRNRINNRGQVYQGADPIELQRSPTFYSRISTPDKLPPPQLEAPGVQLLPKRSIGARTIDTEDFYNTLSRHQSDPNLRSADRRSRVPVTEPPNTSGDGRTATPLPVMTQRKGGRKARSLPELNQTPAIINRDQNIGTQTDMPALHLPSLSANTHLITQSVSIHMSETFIFIFPKFVRMVFSLITLKQL